MALTQISWGIAMENIFDFQPMGTCLFVMEMSSLKLGVRASLCWAVIKQRGSWVNKYTATCNTQDVIDFKVVLIYDVRTCVEMHLNLIDCREITTTHSLFFTGPVKECGP